MAIAFHPYADIFPLMEGTEFAALVEDIAANGIREPIVLHEGMILDGRNRYRACTEAGVEPTFETFSDDDALAYVISLNLKRRHLNESQRAMVAAKLATLRVGEKKANAPIGASSQDDAAEMLNVGRRSVQRAAEVIEKATPELQSAVEHGTASVSAAATVATLPKPKQAEIVARGPEEIIRVANRLKAEKKAESKARRREKNAEIAPLLNTSTPKMDLYKEPCIKALDGDAASVDWIITDPPYPKEFLGVFADLAGVAEHALKPGGSLLCMVGQSYLPDVYAALSARLTYHWTLAYLTPGGQATQIFPRRINTFWKPVLWFVKGEFAGDWIGDVTKSDVNNNDKRFHEWGQSESGMRDLMARFVRRGDVVLDPFMGAGTTGVIALELGARFIGFDVDQDAYNEALVRLDRAELVA